MTGDTQINHFILSVGKPLINDLMTEIEKALEETSQVLTAFDIFNPDNLDKSGSTKKSFVSALINYSGNTLTDTHEKDTNAAIIDESKLKLK